MLWVPEADILAKGAGSAWELRRMQPLGNYKWCRTGDPVCTTNATTDPPHPKIINNYDAQWSSEETDYLVGLCHQFDNRFIIVADRYHFENGDGATTARSANDIRKRYYQLTQTPFDDDQNQRRRLAEESFDARTREQVEEEQELLRILVNVQRDLPALWRRRQAMIARLAGDTFVMNNPSLLDLIGATATADADPEYAPDSGKSMSSKSKNRSRDRGRDRVREKANKVKRAVVEPATPQPTTQPEKQKRQSVAPVLRTAALKPIKAGLARQVDKRLLDIGLPVRPNYPSERNCDLYDQIRALLADTFDKKPPG